jgi:murein endopeptidase/predicted small lipoprotein YifL
MMKKILKSLILLALMIQAFGCGQSKLRLPIPPNENVSNNSSSNVTEEDDQTPLFESGKRDYTDFVELPSNNEIMNPIKTNPSQPKELKLSVKDANLTIDVDQLLMRLRVQLSVGDFTESFDLEGSFRESFESKLAYWAADDVKPFDTNIRKMRKVQATVLCLKAGYCEDVAIEIFYKYNDKIYKKQFTQKLSALTASTQDTKSQDTNASKPESQIKTTTTTTTTTKAVSSDVTKKPQTPNKPVPKSNTPWWPLWPSKKKSLPTPTPAVTVAAPATQTKINEEVEEEEDKSISGEFVMPQPKISDDSIAQLEKQIDKSDKDIIATRIQAVGAHNKGHIVSAANLPSEGTGFFLENKDVKGLEATSYGTDGVITFIRKAGVLMSRENAAAPRLCIGDISKQKGGNFGHHSHQTGLDVDIGLFAKDEEVKTFWSAVGKNVQKHDFDLERNWTFLKLAFQYRQNKTYGRMMAVGLDQDIRKRLCKFADTKGEKPQDPNSTANYILRSIHSWQGHQNHFHMRFYCPGTVGCQDQLVPLEKKVDC